MAAYSRREFLKGTELLIGAAAGAALGGCTESDDPYALPKPTVPGADAWSRGEERWARSVCSQCFAGCSIRARMSEGRVVKLDGSGDYPLNMGSIGPKGQAGVDVLYHPDRIRHPRRRVGPRGSGNFRDTTWEEAIAEIGQELRRMRDEQDPRGLVVLDGDPRGSMRELWERFCKVFGTPNHVDHRSTVDGGKVLAMKYMHGVEELPAYDWSNTNYVVGFGATLMESWCQTIHLVRAAARMHRAQAGHRAKFVQLSPNYSMTATKADEWIPIEPATYGAMALGLAHVLVRERLYDRDFVAAHTHGFEPWQDEAGVTHRGFREVLEDYPPARVAEVTGVPKETIERLAREMARLAPAVALADGCAEAATNGLGTAMAIHALNALLGNLERPGGMLVQKRAPLSPWPEVVLDPRAQAGVTAERLDGAGTQRCPLASSFIQGIPEAILAGRPYPARALFLYRSNPVFSKPDGRKWVEALARVPLVVSFSPLPDESTLWADWVLPDHTYLERWDAVEPVPAVGYATVAIRRPVVPPVHDTMGTADFVIRMAQAVGSTVAEAFPWVDWSAAVRERIAGLPTADGASAREDPQGYWSAGEYQFEQWDTAFATPSRKFEFFSQTMAAQIGAVFPDPAGLEAALQERGIAARGDDLFLPRWQPQRVSGEEAQFPFLLLPYRGINYAEGGVRHLALLCEMPLARTGAWREEVEVSPGDAARLGVRDGSFVWVESTAARRKLQVRINRGVRAGTLLLPLGHGPWPPPAGDQVPATATALIANVSDPLGGIFAWQASRARVRPASG